MTSFGADIKAIWRSDLDLVSKGVLTAVRYHGDADGEARVSVSRIAKMASIHRATAISRLAELVVQGWIARSGDAGAEHVYRVTPVVLGDGSRDTLSPTATGNETPCRPQRHPLSPTATPPVVLGDGFSVTHVAHGDIMPPITGAGGRTAANNVATEQEQQNNRNKQQQRARTREDPAPPSGETGAPVHLDHLGEFVELWLRTQATRQGGLGPGLTGSTAMRDTIAELLRAHDLDRVRWAIRAAQDKTNRGAPSLGFLRKLCAEGPLADAPRQGRTPASPYRNPDQSAPCGPRPVDPSKGEIDF